MSNFSNIDFSKSSICEALISTLEEIRKDFSKSIVLNTLQEKVKEAENYLSEEKEQKKKLKRLLHLFFFRWKFGGAKKKHKVSNILWIDKVLKNFQGTASSLGIILLHIAKVLKINLYPVMFPTQLILKFYCLDKSIWLIDPLNGKTLNNHILDMWIKGNINPNYQLQKKYLKKTPPITVLKNFLNTLKSSLIEEKKTELALKISNVLLKINPKNSYEIRDRGLIYAQLGCYHIAIKDLTLFIKQNPEDPINDLIRIQIQSIKNKIITFH